MTNHSSSINVVCNVGINGSLVSPSNLSQNAHVKRLQATTSLEILPMPPDMIPEENSEKQECESQPQKKCAASQTTEDTPLADTQCNDNDSSKTEIFDGTKQQLCRCPNCNCSNCTEAKKHLKIVDDNMMNLRYQDNDDDDDSGTESYTNEEARRKLSVSSFAMAPASVLIHGGFVSQSQE